MSADRKAVWLAVFADFCLVWSQLTPSLERILVWDRACADLSPGQIQRAAQLVIQNHSSGFPPTPGELRDQLFGPLTWKLTRHHITGQVTGKEYLRELPRRPLKLEEPRREMFPALPREITQALERQWTPTSSSSSNAVANTSNGHASAKRSR